MEEPLACQGATSRAVCNILYAGRGRHSLDLRLMGNRSQNGCCHRHFSRCKGSGQLRYVGIALGLGDPHFQAEVTGALPIGLACARVVRAVTVAIFQVVWNTVGVVIIGLLYTGGPDKTGVVPTGPAAI